MLTRRQFLATTATAIASSPTFAQTTRPKLGFLGASHSHAAEKIRILRQMSEFDFIGIAEDSEKIRDTQQKAGVKILTREEVLQQADVIVVESAVRDHA